MLQILCGHWLLARVGDLLPLLVLGLALLGDILVLRPPRPGTRQLVDE